MKRISIVLVTAALALPACSNGVTSKGDDDGSGSGSGSGSQDEWDKLLGQRQFDYNAALRVAVLRLTGDIPTLQEIQTVANAPDDAAKKTAYEGLVQQYMARPTFARQMVAFWQDTFKLGGSAAFNTAPYFAARLAVENGSYMDLFTKATAGCPTYDAAAGTFADAECMNGGPKAGVLTNPGAMQQFFSNFAFRRTRWVQEMFDCVRFPAEIGTTPTDVGGSLPYMGLWPFNSIASPTNGGGRVNFQDVSAVICANCHTTINHIAPLFAMYDMNGAYQTAISVPTPLDGAPPAKLSDYLPPGESTAWRLGHPAADIPSLGVQMSQDPEVAKCGVARVWNWAFGKTDIVDTLQEVPLETVQTQLTNFTQNGFKMKDLIYAVFTDDNFTKF